MHIKVCLHTQNCVVISLEVLCTLHTGGALTALLCFSCLNPWQTLDDLRNLARIHSRNYPTRAYGFKSSLLMIQ